jgi:hypothetical protein
VSSLERDQEKGDRVDHATLTMDPSAFGIIARMDGEPDRLREAIDLAIERTEGVMSSLPGFRMVTIHLNAERNQVAEYIQWASKADFESFIGDDDLSWHVRRIGELSTAAAFSSYQTHSIITADGSDSVTISTDRRHCTVVGVFECASERQSWVADQLSAHAERVTRHQPGFVSAAYFVSHDGTKVGEYAQWASADDFEIATGAPEHREHVAEIDRHATPDVGRYELIWSFSVGDRADAHDERAGTA